MAERNLAEGLRPQLNASVRWPRAVVARLWFMGLRRLLLLVSLTACSRWEVSPHQPPCGNPMAEPKPLRPDSSLAAVPDSLFVRVTLQLSYGEQPESRAVLHLRDLQAGAVAERRTDAGGRVAFPIPRARQYELHVRMMGIPPRIDTLSLDPSAGLTLVAPLRGPVGINECWPVVRRKP